MLGVLNSGTSRMTSIFFDRSSMIVTPFLFLYWTICGRGSAGIRSPIWCAQGTPYFSSKFSLKSIRLLTSTFRRASQLDLINNVSFGFLYCLAPNLAAIFSQPCMVSYEFIRLIYCSIPPVWRYYYDFWFALNRLRKLDLVWRLT